MRPVSSQIRQGTNKFMSEFEQLAEAFDARV